MAVAHYIHSQQLLKQMGCPLLLACSCLFQSQLAVATSGNWPPRPAPCRHRTLAQDPVLSYISTHLASLRRQCSIRREASLRAAPSTSGPSASAPSHSSRGTSITSGPLAEWELQFEDIRFERPCGAGSFGQVRQAGIDLIDLTISV